MHSDEGRPILADLPLENGDRLASILDVGQSRGLEPGSALRAVFGRYIGRVKLREFEPLSAQAALPPIVQDDAAAVLALLVERRNRDIASAGSDCLAGRSG